MLKRVAVILLACVAATAIAGTALLCTETGFKALVRGAQMLAPGELSVGAVHGRLLDRFELKGVRYTDDSGSIFLGRVAVAWRFSALLDKKVEIISLQASDVAIELPPAKPQGSEQSGNTGPGFPLLAPPVSFRLQKGSMDSLTIVTGDPRQEIRIAGLLLEDLASEGGEISIGRCSIFAEKLQMDIQGRVRFADSVYADLHADFSSDLGISGLAGELALTGTPERLGYDIRLRSPAAAVLKGSAFDLPERFHWDGSLTAEEFALARIDATWPAIALKGVEISGTGDLESYALQIRTGAFHEDGPEVSLAAHITGGRKALALDSFRLSRQEMQLNGNGSLAWEDGVSWQLNLAGNGLDFGLLDSRWPSNVDIAAEVTGAGNALQVQNLWLTREKMKLHGKGSFSWQDGAGGQLNLTGTGIDPGLFAPGWPGNLEADAALSWNTKEGETKAALSLPRLAGELRGYPLNASGGMELDGNKLTIDGLSVHSANSVLEVTGDIEESMGVRFSFTSPGLDAVWPGLSGSLSISGFAGGSLKQPEIAFDLSGSEIAYKTTRADALSGSGSASLRPDGLLAATVTAGQVTQGSHGFDSVAIDLRGQLREHALAIQVVSPESSAGLSLAGGYTDKQWTGLINSGNYHSATFGEWTIHEPVPLHLSLTENAFRQLCLQSGESSAVCLSGRYGQDSWSMNADLDNFPLALFATKQSRAGEIGGFLSGAASLEGNDTGITHGELALSGLDVSMQPEPSGNFARLPHLKTSALNVITDGGGFHIQFKGELDDNSSLSAEGNLTGVDILSRDTSRARLDATVAFIIKDLSPLSALTYPAIEPSGALAGKIEFEGKLRDPAIRGRITLDQGKLFFPGQGITVEDLALNVEGLTDRLHLRLDGKSGGGTLTATGMLPLTLPGEEPVSLEIKGDNFTLINLPELKINVSPDLRLNLSNTRNELSGQVLIPEALIAPVAFYGAVKASKDVEFVYNETQDRQDALPLHADLHVVAGEQVRIRASGLKSLLGGGLHIISTPGKPLKLEGSLAVRQGTYSIYGRQLSIVKGLLFYNGAPPENPGIEVRAENTASGVTTGIEVSGFLREPELEFYSSPPMEKDEIIRRLLLNTSLVGSAEDEGFLDSMTADTMIDPVTSAVVGVKETLGLDDIKLESAKEDEGVSLVIGSWLTPKLYVSYGRNFLTESGNFNTKYVLWNRLFLKTETGAAGSGFDLTYEIEK